MRIKIVVVAGLALMVIAVVVALAHSPLTVAATNGVPPATLLDATGGNAGACQTREALPADTSAIRLELEATTGPRVSVEVYDGSGLLTGGTQGTGWYGSAVTVPIRPVTRAAAHTKLCFQMSELSGLVALFGTRTRPAVAATSGGKSMPGRVTIEYLRPSQRSWWAQAGAVIQHMGLGRAASGTWIVLPIALLATAAIALASWVVVRELG